MNFTYETEMSISRLSELLYRTLQWGDELSSPGFREKLAPWVKTDSDVGLLSDEIVSLGLTDELSELAIKRRIAKSPKILGLLSLHGEKSQAFISSRNRDVLVIQNHRGVGDNVAGFIPG
tara:strand:- start:434 stop:793 length:360 start_codon:yes stop_codon:yes gene_type:complete